MVIEKRKRGKPKGWKTPGKEILTERMPQTRVTKSTMAWLISKNKNENDEEGGRTIQDTIRSVLERVKREEERLD